MSTAAAKDRNARRRARYANDPEYRQMILERERAKRVGDPFDCRTNIPKLANIGVERPYDAEQAGKVDVTFTVEEAARALGRTPKSLYKYFSKGMFPRPPHTIKGPTGLTQEAYTIGEMRALMDVFGKHQAETPYYGVYHTETRDALFKVIETSKD